MNDMHDSWFFIGIFIFIFLIWIITGGAGHKLAFSGPTLALPGALGGGTYLSLPHAPYGKGNVSLPGSSNGSSVSQGSRGSFFGMPFVNASKYKNDVSLQNYVSSAGSKNPQQEYIEMSVSQNDTKPIDISGWKLESVASGKVAIIPKGTETPVSGIITPSQKIILTAGDRVMFISGRSPIGASFRENKCIGYFNNFQKFSPSLPQNCPTPNNELKSLYGSNYIRDNACINYVNTLSRCQVVLSPPVNVSGACQTFLEKNLNYNGCVTAHRNDADFKDKTWRVYLGRTSALWRTSNEVVKLIDSEGKTVAMFSY